MKKRPKITFLQSFWIVQKPRGVSRSRRRTGCLEIIRRLCATPLGFCLRVIVDTTETLPCKLWSDIQTNKQTKKDR